MQEQEHTPNTGRAIIDSILERVGEGNESLIEVSKKVLDGKDHLTFGVVNRKVQPEPPEIPPRMESAARAHVFHDVDGLAAYLAKYGGDNTVVCVDVQDQRAYAVLDERAGYGVETLTFAPPIHPLFEPWESLLEGGPVKLRTLADILTQNRRAVIEPTAKSLIHMLSQVKVSKSITLQRGFGKHSVNGIVCQMDIAGQKQNEELELPDTITIHAPLYIATPAVDLEIDLTIDADDANVYVTCTSPDLVEARITVFERMMEQIKAIEGITVTLGRPHRKEWEYVRQQIR